MRTDLEHALVSKAGVHHAPGLVDGVTHGLFDVDVLALLHGVDGDGRVPVVGSGHHHRVDVAALDQLAVVRVAGTLVAFRHLAAPFLPHIADAHDAAEAMLLADAGESARRHRRSRVVCGRSPPASWMPCRARRRYR